MLKPPDVPWRVPGGESRLACPGHFDQTDYAVTVRGVRRKNVEHAVVVERSSHERPADQPRDVEVTDRDGVGVTESPLGDLGRGPDADPRHRLQPLEGGIRRHVGRLLETVRYPRCGDDRLRTFAVDAG